MIPSERPRLLLCRDTPPSFRRSRTVGHAPSLQTIDERHPIRRFPERETPRYEPLNALLARAAVGPQRGGRRPLRGTPGTPLTAHAAGAPRTTGLLPHAAPMPSAAQVLSEQLRRMQPHASDLFGIHPALAHSVLAAVAAAGVTSAMPVLGYYGAEGLQVALGQPTCAESTAFLLPAWPVGVAVGSCVLLANGLDRQMDYIRETRATAAYLAALTSVCVGFAASIFQVVTSRSAPEEQAACVFPQALSNPAVQLVGVTVLAVASLTGTAAVLMARRAAHSLWRPLAPGVGAVPLLADEHDLISG